MAVYDQAPAAKTPAQTSSTTKEEGAEKKRPTSAEDLVPEENKAAKKDEGTDPNKDGKTADADKAAEADKAKKERAAAVTAKWEATLGKWLGAPLAKIVLENVSLDAMNGYVQDGLKAVAPGIGGVLKDQTKPADQKSIDGLKAFSDALSGVITGQVDTWVKSAAGQKVLKSITDWVQDNPAWVMGIVGAAVIGGAFAVYAANPDLDISVPLNLGKGWEMKAGLDLGKLREIAFQGASIVVANKNAAVKMKAEVKKDETKNEAGEVTKETKEGSLEVTQGKEGEQQVTFALNGKIVDTKDGLVAYSAGGKLELVDPKTGAKVTLKEDGSWDTKGNKKDDFSYQLSVGKDVTGSFKCNLSNATVVDKDGNIHTLSSRELGVAVGSKAAKFEVGQKQEEKDGKTSTTTTVGASAEGQLVPGTMLKGSSNVVIGDDKVVVKMDGKLTTTIAGKPVEIDAAYESDGVVKGKIKLGDGNEYREIIGEKKGDVVTFSTKQVFAGGSLEQKTSSDGKQQTTATAQVGKNQTMTATGGTDGNNVSYEGKDLGGTGIGVKGSAGTDAQGKGQGSLGMTYDNGTLKAYLDATMKQGAGSLNLGASYENKEGFKFDAGLKFDETRMTQLALKMGYRNPDEFKTFLVGYKAEFVKEQGQYSHHVDALLEYSLGKWYARAQGGLDVMGGQVKKTNLDLSLGRDINKDWMVFGGMQMNGAMNQQGSGMDMSYKPYVGLQYGGVGVGVFHDTGSKATGLMLTIPLGRK